MSVHGNLHRAALVHHRPPWPTPPDPLSDERSRCSRHRSGARTCSSPASTPPTSTRQTSRRYLSVLPHSATTSRFATRSARFRFDAPPNGCPLSGASIPSSLILCWRFSASSSVMVSPSVTPTTRPSTWCVPACVLATRATSNSAVIHRIAGASSLSRRAKIRVTVTAASRKWSAAWLGL